MMNRRTFSALLASTFAALALQLLFFEVSALSGGLVSSTPE